MHRMSPTELFQEARLDDAVAAQAAIIRDRPDDIAERLLLCALLAFNGDRPAVRRHLDVLSSAPPEIQPYVAEWRDLLTADDARHAGASPEFVIDPPPHVLRRLEAIEGLRAGRTDGIQELIDAADELAPWVEGHVDGREFDGWRDADDLLGPILEAFHGSRYFWLPVDQVRTLRFGDEEGLRDRLYRPATIRLADGRDWEVSLPTLYSGTAKHPEEGIRSGAGIDWVERAGLMRGAGARLYLFGEEELTAEEFRQVEVRRTYAH
jgi:type VI secretion system protein ImpE